MAENAEHQPTARSDGLLVEHVDAETVVYDSEGKQAHCLSPLAASVFARSDGRTSIPELARLASSDLNESVSVEHASEAVRQLEKLGLMVVPAAKYFSRRTMVRKGAAVGAAVLAAPLVLTVGTAQAQAANCNGSCFPFNRCTQFTDSQCTCVCRVVACPGPGFFQCCCI